MVIILRGGKSFLSFLVFLQHLLLKKQQMTKTSAYFSVFFEFFKIFQQMLINFFMALKYGIRAFERTWTRTKIFKTRFSMLCWSLKVRLILGPFLAKKPKMTKNDQKTPKNSLKSLIFSNFQIEPGLSVFIAKNYYYALSKAQTQYFSNLPCPYVLAICAFSYKEKKSARNGVFGRFWPKSS